MIILSRAITHTHTQTDIYIYIHMCLPVRKYMVERHF